MNNRKRKVPIGIIIGSLIGSLFGGSFAILINNEKEKKDSFKFPFVRDEVESYGVTSIEGVIDDNIVIENSKKEYILPQNIEGNWNKPIAESNVLANSIKLTVYTPWISVIEYTAPFTEKSYFSRNKYSYSLTGIDNNEIEYILKLFESGNIEKIGNIMVDYGGKVDYISSETTMDLNIVENKEKAKIQVKLVDFSDVSLVFESEEENLFDSLLVVDFFVGSGLLGALWGGVYDYHNYFFESSDEKSNALKSSPKKKIYRKQ